MSAEKYIVVVNGNPIALKFNNDEVTIGSYLRFRKSMEDLIMAYFKQDGLQGFEPIFTQRNKIRFVFSFTRVKFNKAIDELREHRFILDAVKSHGRLMR